MNEFLLLTTKDKNGGWFGKSIFRIADLDFITTVFDEQGREEYNHSHVLLKDRSRIPVKETVDEIYKMLVKKGGEE